MAIDYEKCKKLSWVCGVSTEEEKLSVCELKFGFQMGFETSLRNVVRRYMNVNASRYTYHVLQDSEYKSECRK